MPLPAAAALAAVLALPLAGCDLDRLLEVPDPAVATPPDLEGPQAAPILLAGAHTDFQVGFSGSGVTEGLVNMSGLFTDELHYTSTFPTRIEVDKREITVTNSTMEALHRNVQRARASAARAVESNAEHRPNTAGHAEALNLLGFSIILLAESYCSGVPFSTLTATGDAIWGEPQTTEQMFEQAVTAFEQARAAATAAGAGVDAVRQQNLSRVGLGRALLNLSRPADAAAAVAEVPTGFVYEIFHSENSSRQENAAFVFQHLGRRWAVADREGGGLAFRSDNDPRVPWQLGTGAQATGFDDSPLYLQLRYPSRAANTVLASGVEARLIEAEHAQRTGGDWLGILNQLRAEPPAYYPNTLYPNIAILTPLSDPGTEAARVDLLFQERAYWMYLTAHRLGDLRRLIRQYNRSQETVFPSGEYGVWVAEKSGVYGTDVNFPIPFDEQNNPQFQGCLNRDA